MGSRRHHSLWEAQIPLGVRRIERCLSTSYHRGVCSNPPGGVWTLVLRVACHRPLRVNLRMHLHLRSLIWPAATSGSWLTSLVGIRHSNTGVEAGVDEGVIVVVGVSLATCTVDVDIAIDGPAMGDLVDVSSWELPVSHARARIPG